MKIKVGNWYLNDNNVDDPHLVDNVKNATEQTQNEVNDFISHYTTYEGEKLFILSLRKWYEVYLNDINILQ